MLVGQDPCDKQTYDIDTSGKAGAPLVVLVEAASMIAEVDCDDFVWSKVSDDNDLDDGNDDACGVVHTTEI